MMTLEYLYVHLMGYTNILVHMYNNEYVQGLTINNMYTGILVHCASYDIVVIVQ